MDVYTERTIKLMQEHKFDQYLKLMTDSAIPTKNKIAFIYLKVQEFEEEAKQQIMKEAMDRKAKQNGR